MKLLNYTTSYFAAILLLVITVWAAVYYYTMLDEIYDSIDDGLDNQKQLIIKKAGADTSLLNKPEFGEAGFRITPISREAANKLHDVYIDSSMYMENEGSQEPIRLLKTVFLSGGKYYHLEVATSMVEEDDLVNALVYALIWLYLGIVLPVLILNNVLLKKVWKPFYRMLSQLKDFRIDRSVNIQTQQTNIEEFRLLNDALQEMQNNNLEVFTSQKHFIENAAHELQTPLGIAINKLEHLAEQDHLSDQQLALLSSALDNLDRLTRLNRSLLLLSKIENRQYTGVTPVHLQELIQKITDDFQEQAQYKGISLTIDTKDCIVQMHEDLAMILLSNLIKNAVLHTPPGGSINISLQHCLLVIKNSGNKPLIKDRLFSRFDTQHPATQSTGLGLSIVKAITDLYHFRIDYQYLDQHVITVAFTKTVIPDSFPN